MKINTSMTGAVIRGLLVGVIYFIIAIATGTSAVSSIIGGIALGAIAIIIGIVFLSFYKRRATGPHE